METDYASQINSIIRSQGLELNCEKITESSRRRVVGKLKGAQENYAIKLVTQNSDVEAFSLASSGIVREAEVLRELSVVLDDLYFAHGQDEAKSWLITKWLEGDGSTDVCKVLRVLDDKVDMKLRFLTLFIEMMKKVLRLHDLGYVHGDIQPAHFLIDHTSKVSLIDFELTRKADDREFTFGGGLVHYNSPEVARGMLKGDKNIPFDIISEIYSVGSALFFLYTGKTSTYYGSYDYKSIPMQDKLKCITQGRIPAFGEADAHAFPELEEVLRSCLEHDRAKRCNGLEQAITQLQSIRIAD